MYIIIEIQQQENGQTATLVNQRESRDEAYSVYHTILAAAAISSVAQHSAAILRTDGSVVTHESFTHQGGETA